MRNVPADNRIVKAARHEKSYIFCVEDCFSFSRRGSRYRAFDWRYGKRHSGRKPKHKNHRR